MSSYEIIRSMGIDVEAVLVNMPSQSCEDVASERKTFEVRKNRPSIDIPFKCYIYCATTGNPYGYPISINTKKGIKEIFTGMVIGEFICDEIIEDYNGENSGILCNQGCLTLDELIAYRRNRPLYGWHISNLVIYDEPKNLREFRKPGGIYYAGVPTAWKYVNELK